MFECQVQGEAVSRSTSGQEANGSMGIYFERHLSMLCVLTVIVSAFTACSKARYERTPVSGMVTYQGKPIQTGQIRFTPQPGTKAPVVIEEIVDGKYTTATSGGVPPGTYIIELCSFDPDAPPQLDPLDPPPAQLLPAQFNSASTLEAVLEPGEGPKVLDFSL